MTTCPKCGQKTGHLFTVMVSTTPFAIDVLCKRCRAARQRKKHDARAHCGRSVSDRTRKLVLARDHSRCRYCGVRVPCSAATMDHILPWSRGGKSCSANIATACSDCNTRKGNRTPEEAGMPLIPVDDLKELDFA